MHPIILEYDTCCLRCIMRAMPQTASDYMHLSRRQVRSNNFCAAACPLTVLPDHSCKRNLPAPSSWHVPTDLARRSRCITASARGWSTCWLPAKPRHPSVHSGELCRRRRGGRLRGGGGGCVSTMHLLPPQARRRPPVLLHPPSSHPDHMPAPHSAAIGLILWQSSGSRSAPLRRTVSP
jgi:hypothetical protein